MSKSKVDDFEYNPPYKYQRIIQNPPFENFLDIDFTYHAYELLEGGGILVSILKDTRFNKNTNRKTVKRFLNWLDEMGNYQVIDFLENIKDEKEQKKRSFKISERYTGTGTKLLVMKKSKN